jgi:hypothetical protein
MSRPLAFQLLPLVVQDQECVELVGADVFEADVDPQVERRPKFERAPDQQARLGVLRRLQVDQGAVVTPAPFRRVRTQAGVAEFIPAKGPVDQIPQGGPFRPLPC